MKVYKQNDAFFMEDNGEVVEITPNKDYWLKLPTNSVNRVWVSCKRVDKAEGQMVDYGTTVKQPRVIGSYERNAKKPLEDYLSDEDRVTYLMLVEKAKKAREEANKKVLTPLEKAQRNYEKALRALELLKGGNK